MLHLDPDADLAYELFCLLSVAEPGTSFRDIKADLGLLTNAQVFQYIRVLRLRGVSISVVRRGGDRLARLLALNTTLGRGADKSIEKIPTIPNIPTL